MSSDRFLLTRRFVGSALNYWPVFSAMLVCMVLGGLMQPLLPWMLAPLLDSAAASTANYPLPSRTLPAFMFAVVFVLALSNYGASYFGGWIDATLQRDYRRLMAQKLVALPFGRIKRDTSGMLTSRFMQFLPQMTGAALPMCMALVQETLKLVGYIGLMFYWQWQMALVVLLAAPLASGIIHFFGRRMKEVAGRAQQGIAHAQSRLNESLAAMPVLKMSGQSPAIARLTDVFNRLRGDALRIRVVLSAGQPLNHVLIALPFAAVVWGVMRALETGDMTSGEAASFLTIMLLLPVPVRNITRAMHTWEQMLVAAREIYGFLDTPGEEDRGARVITRARGDIHFNRVCFKYSPGGEEPLALDNCTLQVSAGEVVALVGRSGAGKSTLCNLLPRFYAPQSGDITLDGQPLGDCTLASLRRQIALVPQKPSLFDDSVAFNVAFPDQPSDKARIMRALRDAAADEFVSALPQGADSRIGEGGDSLSGGQQQRLMLARAFYQDAPIIILDEPTAALDAETEQHIKIAMRRLFAGRTVLIIAHRFSSINFAHRIAVMENGKITQTGSAEQLRQTSPHFADLYNMQKLT